MSSPSDAAFEHCNHGYAKLQHFHADHRVTVLLNAGSITNHQMDRQNMI
jgi:hypothetical protein